MLYLMHARMCNGTDAFGFMMQKGMALEGKVVLG
jgi:hypothetical protein